MLKMSYSTSVCKQPSGLALLVAYIAGAKNSNLVVFEDNCYVITCLPCWPSLTLCWTSHLTSPALWAVHIWKHTIIHLEAYNFTFAVMIKIMGLQYVFCWLNTGTHTFKYRYQAPIQGPIMRLSKRTKGFAIWSRWTRSRARPVWRLTDMDTHKCTVGIKACIPNAAVYQVYQCVHPLIGLPQCPCVDVQLSRAFATSPPHYPSLISKGVDVCVPMRRL